MNQPMISLPGLTSRKKNVILPKVKIYANYLSGSVISDESDKFAKYVDSYENSPKAEISEEKIVHVYDE